VNPWARPARPVAPIAVAIGIVGLWWLVAHNGGAGWVQLLGDVVFGTLVIGVVGPWPVVARARIAVRSAPGDACAGLPVELHVDASTRLRVRPVEPPGPEVFVGPARRRGPTPDTITVVPERHAVLGAVTVDIASAAPFALQWWTRRVQVTLPSELHVAPRRGRPERPRTEAEEESAEVRERPRSDAGLPRGARPYAPGDNRRLVHWRATAHAGRLMVRELERPSAGPVTVMVDLPADPDEAERVAERALGTVVELLATGAPVLLGTHERSGRVLAAVSDRRGAGRRLARAVPAAGAADGGGGGGG
jgi:uncharacterized protein (DUF58 family)